MERGDPGAILKHRKTVWMRCTVRLSKEWLADEDTRLTGPEINAQATAWMNGVPLMHSTSAPDSLTIAADSIVPDDIHLLVIRMDSVSDQTHLPMPPKVVNGERELSLSGRWQFRIGDDPAWSNIPLPAKFGMGSDVLFEPR